MAFDEISFPLRVRIGAKGGPAFMTEIVTLAGGQERRNQKWSQARRHYDARSCITSAAEASLLAAFFQARAGRARGFRLKDWSDFTSARDGVSMPVWVDQRIGTGDGVKTTFQLIKTYGSGEVQHVREITKPVAGTVHIGVDGIEYQTGWSVDLTTGIVTFAQAPAAGAFIYAGYQFDVPVRFDTDRLNLSFDEKNLAGSEVPLIEVRV